MHGIGCTVQALYHVEGRPKNGIYIRSCLRKHKLTGLTEGLFTLIDLGF